MTYYILIRRKRETKVIGIIPAKPGVSVVKLRQQLRKNLKSSLTFNIVNKGKLGALLKRKPRTPRKTCKPKRRAKASSIRKKTLRRK